MTGGCWKSSPRHLSLIVPLAAQELSRNLIQRVRAMKSTDLVDNQYLRTDIPEFGPGDEVKVHVKVVEGNKERVQVFQGNVIARQGSGVAETYTVRKVSYGVGVERTFPLHTPTVAKLEVVKRATCAGPSCTTCAIASARRRRSRKSATTERSRSHRCKRAPPLSSDDLENFEAERELQLAQEYQDVAAMFRFAVETERRFYLANDVKVTVTGDAARPVIEVELTDAWVWDMYRKTRFVPKVRVLTFKDVNVEELPLDRVCSSPRWPIRHVDGGARTRRRGGTCATATRSSTATGGATGELDLVAARRRRVVFCEVKARATDQFGPAGPRSVARKQRTLRCSRPVAG